MATAFQSDAFQNNAFQIDVVPPTPSGGTTPSGVRRGKGKKRERELIISLRDVENREDTAEFLKSQLRLRHPSAFVEPAADDRKDKARLAAQAKREAAMRARAAAEDRERLQSEAQAESERKRQVDIYNDNVRILMLIAASLE